MPRGRASSLTCTKEALGLLYDMLLCKERIQRPICETAGGRSCFLLLSSNCGKPAFAGTATFLRSAEFLNFNYAAVLASNMSSTGQDGADSPEHRAIVSARICSSLARSASFARTSSRCACAISRTSAQEPRAGSARANSARISSMPNPSSRARRMKASRLTCAFSRRGGRSWCGPASASARCARNSALSRDERPPRPKVFRSSIPAWS